MFGLPSNFDPSFLCGRTMDLVCFTTHQVNLHFSDGCLISVEGEMSLDDGENLRLPDVLSLAYLLIDQEINHALAPTRSPLPILQKQEDPSCTRLESSIRILCGQRKRRDSGESLRISLHEKRYYDFNVFSERKHIEKPRYMHRNPVKRGLINSPELWRWSSFRDYSLAEEGPVKIGTESIPPFTV